MLLLTATTDKIQIISGQAVTVDVHASYVDYASGAVTPGRANTAISTATTTDVVAAPAASTQRNVKALTIRNKSAGSAVDITVQFNQNGTLYELHKTNLAAGDMLQFVDGQGFTKILASAVFLTPNAATADQTANAADTYLAASALSIPTATRPIKVGTIFRWKISATKTAAGVATPIWSVRFGTLGTTSDTARLTFTQTAQTAATDTGWWLVDVTVRGPIGASAIVQGFLTAFHQNASTGFSNQAVNAINAVSSAFDITTSNMIVGLSVNPGASGVWTIQQVVAEALGI